MDVVNKEVIKNTKFNKLNLFYLFIYSSFKS